MLVNTITNSELNTEQERDQGPEVPNTEQELWEGTNTNQIQRKTEHRPTTYNEMMDTFSISLVSDHRIEALLPMTLTVFNDEITRARFLDPNFPLIHLYILSLTIIKFIVKTNTFTNNQHKIYIFKKWFSLKKCFH